MRALARHPTPFMAISMIFWCNRVEANAHNACTGATSDAIHGHINDFLVRTGLRGGVSEL